MTHGEGAKGSRKKLILMLVVIFLVNILIITCVQSAQAATYRYGSQGETVKKIQQVLKNNGFYTGSIDGIYGSKTVSAVKAFQKNCGLTADGICGPVTLKYLGLGGGGGGTASGSSPSSGSTSYQSNLALLARIISAEARGEPYKGQVAVGAVIINRTKHPSFPSTLAGVIYQPGAFTAVSDGQINGEPTDSAKRAAADALNGWDPTSGCIYYFNPSTATSSWIWSRPQVITIGDHIFCR